MSSNDNLPVGVIGVGSMGRNHARVYSELPGAELVGVADTDRQRAHVVADEYGTEVLDRRRLVARAEAISVAVPTEYHFDVARECIEAGVNVLVEKPFVEDSRQGRELSALASEQDVVLQVGHIERFNPAVDALFDLVTDLDVIAVDFRRLGPPLDRDINDSVVLDLMIHDLDIALELIDADIRDISAASTRGDQYATARIDFANDVIGTFTASRRTQRKVRTVELTTESCQISLDYLDQSIQIHRRSRPEYADFGDGMRFRQESVIERPLIDTGEPLRIELESFVGVCCDGGQPKVTAADGLRAMEVAHRIDEIAAPPGELVSATAE